MDWKVATKLKYEATNGAKIECTYILNFTENPSQNLALSESLLLCHSQ